MRTAKGHGRGGVVGTRYSGQGPAHKRPREIAGVQAGSNPAPARFFEFRLSSQISGGKNSMGITRTGHHYPRKAFAVWRDAAIAEMLPWPPRPLRGDVAMRVDYRPQDSRRRDMTGMLDALFHALEFIHAIEDDSQVRHLIWRQDMTLPVCAIVRLEEVRL